MTPGARAAAAVECLTAIEDDQSRPADQFLGEWFRSRRYAGSGDRAAISRLVYTVLRRRAQLDWCLAKAGGEPDARARVLAALLVSEAWPPKKIAEEFDGSRYRPATLSEHEKTWVERLAGSGLDDPQQPVHVRANVPEWIMPLLKVSLGGAYEAELAALLSEAPVDLRVNTLKASREEAASILREEGIDAVPTPHSPAGLRLAGRVALRGSPAFRNGLVELQDEGSQIAALLVEAQPDERVLDFCAGAGGKSLALAASMSNRGKIVASDVAPGRLRRAEGRLARAGVKIVVPVVLGRDGSLPTDNTPLFDRVLVDAPCTGTGTWRRSPESRWRLNPEILGRHVASQASILDAAARNVAPGGRLVYAVCSLLAEEGEAQIRGFLGRRPDFEVVPVRRIWARAIGGECPAGDAYLRLLPGRDSTDGFFVAVLARGKES